jgi:hypothetical protein
MLFSASGSYLNQSVATSSNGEAAYNLADGTYRVTASYLGYEYTTDLFTVPLVASQTLAIPHQAHTVSVFRTYQNDRVPLANIEATLCTEDGSPLALNAATGADGTLQWSLPSQAYRVQALYLGRTYLSEPYTSGNPAVLIPEGLARVVLLQGGAALPNTQVVAISDSDPDHPRSLTTDANGVAEFRLPAGSYTFKATLGSIRQLCASCDPFERNSAILWLFSANGLMHLKNIVEFFIVFGAAQLENVIGVVNLPPGA